MTWHSRNSLEKRRFTGPRSNISWRRHSAFQSEALQFRSCSTAALIAAAERSVASAVAGFGQDTSVYSGQARLQPVMVHPRSGRTAPRPSLRCVVALWEPITEGGQRRHPRTSRCRSPAWQLRMNVESTLTVIADAAVAVLLKFLAHSERVAAQSHWCMNSVSL